MILILTAPDDPHAHAVQTALAAVGARCVRFDPGSYPVSSAASVRLGTEPGAGELRAGTERIRLEEIGAIWHRRPSVSVAAADVRDAQMQAYIPRGALHFLEDVWELLDCPQIPARRSVYRRVDYKITQLSNAEREGFDIPPTLVSNDPQLVLEFIREYEGRVISKPLDPFLNSYFLAPRYQRYTEVVSTRDLGYLASVRHAAMIFQAYVPKRLELRVTVVGEQVFAAEIHSQHTRHTRHDWRRYDHLATPMYSHELPEDEAQRCRRLVHRLGLSYGALDLVLTPEGRYVFLELNPNGQYLWVERRTRQPISSAVAALLCRADARGESEIDARRTH